MKITPEHNDRMKKMLFSSVYPYYVVKVEKKGRTKKIDQDRRRHSHNQGQMRIPVHVLY